MGIYQAHFGATGFGGMDFLLLHLLQGHDTHLKTIKLIAKLSIYSAK